MRARLLVLRNHTHIKTSFLMRPGKKTISDVGGRSKKKRGEVEEKESSSVSL